MMINKRLIKTVEESRKYIGGNVVFQWFSLMSNVCAMFSVTAFLQKLFYQSATVKDLAFTSAVVVGAVAVRFLCALGAGRMSYLSSKAVKKKLRDLIYKKLLRLGSSYNEKVKTSEVVQVAVEGTEQLETYFGAYLPQFFYAMLAPLTLFVVLSFVNFLSALLLLICVPLIPVAIAAVQTWAKKLLSKYWGQYTTLGDTFLENLQGLTTLKIYKADEYKNEKMNEEAEKFRKITMKVLTMQLNSITIMDLIAYGGAALGVIVSVSQFALGKVSLSGCLLIILLSADFFIPMRQLGSFFHIAMNGMAASDKIFRLLDLPEKENRGLQQFPKEHEIKCENVSFSYDEDREILKSISMSFPVGSFTAIAGESGCGKSTVASLLTGKNTNYSGKITVGGIPISEIDEDSLMKNITYVSHNSYLFKGTVYDNLIMGNPDATEEEMWEVLDKTKLSQFLKSEKGLETVVAEKGSNLSGGQCQRLALARALLHDSPVYIFDEATSNIDVESENDIMEQIQNIAEEKTVILISHRLANTVKADRIYVLNDGKIAEYGNHDELIKNHGVYEKMWNAQQSLENYGKEVSAE